MNEKKAKILRYMAHRGPNEVEGTAYLVKRHQKFVRRTEEDVRKDTVSLQHIVHPDCERGRYLRLKRESTLRGPHGVRLYW